jgi:YhcH/YjgK/YiaL family protein
MTPSREERNAPGFARSIPARRFKAQGRLFASRWAGKCRDANPHEGVVLSCILWPKTMGVPAELEACGSRGVRDSARMAIFGPFSTVRAQSASDPRFAAAHRYVADLLDSNSTAYQRLGKIAPGITERVNLDGGAFALEQVYYAKPRAEVFLESHRKYIDVQVIMAGAERMEVIDISRLQESQAYWEERDLIKYADTAATSHLRMDPGNVAIFFPADGHLSTLNPDIGPVLVRKSVVKVPVD